MADGAQTEQMALQEMAQHLDEMRTQQAELKGEIGDMFSEMKADLLGILKQALKLPEQTTVTNPNPSVETVTNLEPFVEPMKSSGPFIESLKHASVLQVPGSISDVFLVHRVDSHVKEVEELPQESTNGNEKNVARQVFDEMPLALSSKEKQRKSVKAWKFKFKISFKRSKLMDNMLSVGEETVLLDKVHKETIWGCVKKEFKEIMAACGKKRIDQFKIGEETLKPAVYDGTVQFRVWDCGGSPLECADESYCDGKSSEEAVTVLEACPQLLNTFFRICDNNKLDNSWVCNDRQTMAVCDAENKKLLNIEVGAKKGKNSFMNPQPLHDKRITRALLVGLVGTEEKLSERLSLANYVWKPGELLGVQDHWDWISEVHNMGSVLKIMQRFHGLHLQGIINMDMRFREVIVHDVLSVKVCLSVCNRKFEAELEVYFLAHHNSKNQKIAGGLIYGYVKFHLKHKWRSRLEFCVDNAILFTSSAKLLFSKNNKLLHYEAEFCAQYNDLKQLSTEFQSFPGLNYFAYLIFIWNQALNCGCEAGHISSGFFSVGDVHGDETLSKRLLVLDEISLLDNDVKVNLTIKANWFYKAPMIRGVYHLQRPPELIEPQGNPNFITKVLVQWKEHPPDQFLSGSQWQEFNFSSLRTRMFRRGKYCDRRSYKISHFTLLIYVLVYAVQLGLVHCWFYGGLYQPSAICKASLPFDET